MKNHPVPSSHVLRATLGGALLMLALSACQLLPAPISEQLVPAPSLDAQLLPAPSPSDQPAPEPLGKTVCESSADFQATIASLRDTDLAEEGAATLLVRIDAAIDEARVLAGLVGEELRPTVDALVASLEGLRTTVQGLADQETLAGAAVAIGASLTQVAEAVEALGEQLRTTCP